MEVEVDQHQNQEGLTELLQKNNKVVAEVDQIKQQHNQVEMVKVDHV